ncbi:MAG: phosphoglucosamine mutase, partial [Atribacterota bacterium]|nr:phosphoglucosamine mutase [Atribacterota bacterium]
NKYPLTAEVAFNLGRAVGYYYQNKDKKNALIGKDTRLSGDMLEAALTAGLCSTGFNVITAGIITTPGVAFLTKYFNIELGIVISASHNPFHDNGIKFFNGNGYKLSEKQEKDIENIFFNESYAKLNISGSNIGKVESIKNATDLYISHIIKTIPNHFIIPDYKIIIDCANGASSKITEELFNRLNFKNIKIINNVPDGYNINYKCGSTYLKTLQLQVLQDNADLGFAYDGDADRALTVDEKGQIVDGDQMMFIYAYHFLKKGELGNNTIVTTHMSNMGFDETIREIGGKVIRTDIGDKYVLKKMIENNSYLGGEQSGHIIFLKYGPHGDGIETSIQLLSALGENDEKISSQAAKMKKYHQKLLNFTIKNKQLFLQDNKFREIKEEMLSAFKFKGRILIRPSGTEKIIRILLESKNEDILEYWENVLNEYFEIYTKK